MIGDVVSDLMVMLIDELLASGDLTAEDQALADATERVKEVREGKKDNVKKVG